MWMPMNESYQAMSQLYGGVQKEARYVRRQRQRMNFVSLVQCLFIPWILFCIVYGVMSFHLHYTKPWLCWSLVALVCLVTLGIGSAAYKSYQGKMRQEEGKEPTWLIFMFITTVIAVVLGVVLGNQVFSTFMVQYYDYLNLNDYQNVNVAKMRGEQLMDSARMSFAEGATLDLRKAIGFRNQNTYCVAPITIADKHTVMAELTNYDFWAVGLNCCSGDNTDFHCGEYNNPKARGALRLLENDDRPFYRLAVQQAEAMYHIKAAHPLFLYWTEDPESEMESWRMDGHKFFFIGMVVHFCWQLLCVGLGVAGISKMAAFA